MDGSAAFEVRFIGRISGQSCLKLRHVKITCHRDADGAAGQPLNCERAKFRYLPCSVTKPVESLGVIAGNRSLPLLFAQQARSMGVKRLVAVAFEGETEQALTPLVDEIVWLKVGQLSKLISAFTDRG